MTGAKLARPGTRKRALQDAALERYLAHAAAGELPTSATFIYYELAGRGVVSNAPVNSRTGKDRKRTHRQDTSDALMVLRRLGLVPWEDIADETRILTAWHSSVSVYEYARASLERARLDLWAGGPSPLIVCESRSLSGVLRPIASEYLADITATNGQTGGHLHVHVGPALAPGRPVLYLGDHDHAGGQIEANTRRSLEEIVEREIPWTRVAITAEQIAERGLAPVVKTKVDKRYRGGLAHEAWETEALGQGTVVALVREALEALLPEPIEVIRQREDDQRAEVRRLLDGEER